MTEPTQVAADPVCRRSDACAECGTRRDEHPDQLQPAEESLISRMLHESPRLQADHDFAPQPGGYPDHYADYGCGAWEPAAT